MEFNIDVKTGLNGHIIIEDYSREYSQYLPEDQEIQELGRYKYSDCYTLDVLTKITTSETIVINTSIHKHDQLIEDPINSEKRIYDVERTKLRVLQDGFYHLHHIIIPTEKWYNNTYINQSEEYKTHFDAIYIIKEDNIVYKVQNSELIPVNINELLIRNWNNTTLEQCVIDIFYTGFLQMCYINYCKQLFNMLTKNCDYKCVKEDISQITYARDFLWMVLNVIDYQISFKQYMESQRILELINYCGGFCKQPKYHENVGCGCS